MIKTNTYHDDSTDEWRQVITKIRHKQSRIVFDDDRQPTIVLDLQKNTVISSDLCQSTIKISPGCPKPLLCLHSKNQYGCPHIDDSIECTLVPLSTKRNNNNNNNRHAKENIANRLSYYTRKNKQQAILASCNKLANNITRSQTYNNTSIILILLSLLVSISASHKISSKSVQFFKNDIERIAATAKPTNSESSDYNSNNKNYADSNIYSYQQYNEPHQTISTLARDRRSRQQQFISQQVHSNKTNQDEIRSINRTPSTNFTKYSLWKPLTTTLIDVPSDKTGQPKSDQHSSINLMHSGSDSSNNVSSNSSNVVATSLEQNSSLHLSTQSISIKNKRSDSDVASSNRNTLIANLTSLATPDQQQDDLLAASPFIESPLNSAVVSSSPSPSMISSNYHHDSYNDNRKLKESNNRVLEDSEDGQIYGKKVVRPRHNGSTASDQQETTKHKNGKIKSEGLVRMSSEAKPVQQENKKRDGDLEAFLENMNHMELRAAAFGQPLPNSFLEKPLDNPQKNSLISSAAISSQQRTANTNGELARQQSHHHHTNYQHMLHHQQSRHKHHRESYSDCALILQRTYVKNTNEKNDIPYGKTEQACISYKDINRAIELAKNKLKLNKKTISEGLTKSLEPPEAAVAAIGEINMAVTQILADKFDLSNDEILNGLPLIDMSKTKFWKFCPMLVIPIKCEESRFRTFTGHCNNPHHPTWGAALTPFARYLPPVHPDGIWEPRKSIITEITYELTSGHHETVANHQGLVSRHRSRSNSDSDEDENHDETSTSSSSPSPSNGDNAAAASASDYAPHFPGKSRPLELPSARLVTSIVHRDVNLPSHEYSILFMSWGQLLDHDMSRAAQPPSDIKCCGNQTSGQPRHKLCLPISVADDDPFYSRFGVKCLEFRRSLAGLRPNCVLGPRVHQNAITAPIDANFVYGSSTAMANNLRLFKGGKLRSRDWFKKQDLKPLLPAQDVNPDLECIARPKNLFCFLAGDVRANEQTHLTVLHTLYMRDHNRMASRLSQLNPHWNDDRIYHETRHIMAATVQNALLSEYLPLLIGQKMCHLYNLTQPSGGDYWHGYDATVTTSVSNSFAAAAFRQGHTFIQSTVDRYNKFHQFLSSERLRHLFKQPFLLYEAGVLDQLTGGMINQPTQSYDPFMAEDISGHLFQPPKQEFGHDLPAINLQRGREQGLPGYNLFREWCGLPRAETFQDLEPFLTNKTAYLYSRLYKHVDDIDLWSGGVSERRLPGAAIGPTFACIIARQFSNTRRGDKYWFENGGFASSFTPDQLIELRKSSLAKLLCANSDDLPTIQRWALKMPHPVLNPRTPCEKIPDIDLRYWQQDKHTGHYYNSKA